MNKKTILILSTFVLSILVISCKNEEVKVNDTVAKKDTTSKEEKSCYLYASNNDTVYLSIDPGKIGKSGELNFLPYEKDARIGTLSELTTHGDTLFAKYNSTQEGMTNDGEVAFLKTKEGYIISDDIWGTENYQYNETYTIGTFKDKHKIKFTGNLLKKIPCK